MRTSALLFFAFLSLLSPLSPLSSAEASKTNQPPFEGAALPQRYDLTLDRENGDHRYVPWDPSESSSHPRERRANRSPNYVIRSLANGNAEIHDLDANHVRIVSRALGENPTPVALFPRQEPESDLPDELPTPPSTTAQHTTSVAAPTVIPGPSPATPAFSVTLKCTVDTAVCDRTASAFARAINRLATSIEVRNTILISASYHPFCDLQCFNSSFGWAAADSQWLLPGLVDVDPNFVHPQSLAKQLLPYDLAWSLSDISCEFNHNAYLNVDTSTSTSNGTAGVRGGTFWFPEDNMPILPDQVDMEYLILHELLHGLGFTSTWGSYFYPNTTQFYNLVTPPFQAADLKVLTPAPRFRKNTNTQLDLLSGFMPSSIFDKYIHSSFSSFETLAFELQDICIRGNGTDAASFFQHIKDNSSIYNTAQQLWNVAIKPGSLFFVNDRTLVNVTISTSNISDTSTPSAPPNPVRRYNGTVEGRPKSFRPGIAISHLDPSLYALTSDFIMLPYIIPGSTLSKIIADSQNSSVAAVTLASNPPTAFSSPININSTAPMASASDPAIGKNTLLILRTMGYSTSLSRRPMPATASNDTTWQTRLKASCDPGIAVASSDVVGSTETCVWAMVVAWPLLWMLSWRLL